MSGLTKKSTNRRYLVRLTFSIPSLHNNQYDNFLYMFIYSYK